MKAVLKYFLIAISISVASLAIDRILFDKLLFSFQNPTGWDSFRWYNFEYLFRSLENERSLHKDKKYVLIVGSSIAQYSILRDRLEKELSESAPVHVELLTHAAMLPTDLRYYANRILRLKPDLIIYATGSADLDLERTTPPWEAAPVRSTVSDMRFLKQRLPAKMYYPGAFGAEEDLNLDSKASFAFSRFMFSARFARDHWFPFIDFILDKRKPWKSYLNYQGVPIKGGLFREGRTGACFALPGTFLVAKSPDVLELQIEYPAEFSGTPLTIEYWKNANNLPNSDFCPDGNGDSQKITLNKTGWQKISVSGKHTDEFYFRLSHVAWLGTLKAVDKGTKIYTGRGVRLPGNLGRKEIPDHEIVLRRPNLEEARIESLTPDQYPADYKERIEPDIWMTRPEMLSMGRMRLSKLINAYYGFLENRETEDLKRALTILKQTPILILNQPENPITLDQYQWSSFYPGYLQFYKSLEGGSIKFADFHNVMEMRDFGDPHHLTYNGAAKLQPRLVTLIRPYLKAGQESQ